MHGDSNQVIDESMESKSVCQQVTKTFISHLAFLPHLFDSYLPTRRCMQNSSQSIRQRPTDPTAGDNDDVIRFDFATPQEASYTQLM